jgi:hypothetical protein
MRVVSDAVKGAPLTTPRMVLNHQAFRTRNYFEPRLLQYVVTGISRKEIGAGAVVVAPASTGMF